MTDKFHKGKITAAESLDISALCRKEGCVIVEKKVIMIRTVLHFYSVSSRVDR